MTRGPALLFLCGGRRVGLIQRFRAALQPYDGRILLTDTEPWTATSFFADRTWRVAPCSDGVGFRDDVVSICGEETVVGIVPLTCSAVAALPLLEGRTSARLIGGDALATAIVTDKSLTADYLAGKGLATPQVREHPESRDLPLFRRYRKSEGSRGAKPIRTPEDLALVRDEAGQVFTRYLSGPEYSVDCYKDLGGTILSIVPRLRLRVRAGEVEKAILRRAEPLIDMVRRAIEPLKFVGPATVQAIHCDGTFYLTEINLRYGGGVTLSINAGMASPEWLVAELMEHPAPVPGPIRWGMGMCRYDQDVYFEERAGDHGE